RRARKPRAIRLLVPRLLLQHEAAPPHSVSPVVGVDAARSVERLIRRNSEEGPHGLPDDAQTLDAIDRLDEGRGRAHARGGQLRETIPPESLNEGPGCGECAR